MLGLPRTTLLLCFLLLGMLVALLALWGVQHLDRPVEPTTREIKNLVATFQMFLEVGAATPGSPATPAMPVPGAPVLAALAALGLGGWATGRSVARLIQHRSRSTRS